MNCSGNLRDRQTSLSERPELLRHKIKQKYMANCTRRRGLAQHIVVLVFEPEISRPIIKETFNSLHIDMLI